MKSLKQAQVEALLAKKLSISVFDHEMAKLGIYVVKPKEFSSTIFFRDERRYFPKLNEDDIVVGGYFG